MPGRPSPLQERSAGAGPARRPGRPSGARPRRAVGRETRRHRGPAARLRLPRGRAGPEPRPSRRPDGGPAALGRWRHRQPLLRLLNDFGPCRCRLHRDGGGRGLRLRRCREHEPGADDGLQSDAAPRLCEVEPGTLHRHGRYGRERRPALADPASSRKPSPCARRSARRLRSQRAGSPRRSCRSPASMASSTWTDAPGPRRRPMVSPR